MLWPYSSNICTRCADGFVSALGSVIFRVLEDAVVHVSRLNHSVSAGQFHRICTVVIVADVGVHVDYRFRPLTLFDCLRLGEETEYLE